MNQSNQLEFLNVSVRYNGDPALDEVTFRIDHGAQVAVVGPNGAGKSTVFKALVGLVPLRGGEIRVHGLPVRAHQACVAYVPQRSAVDWAFPVTVYDVVMMGRYGRQGWMGRATPADRAAVSAALEQMGLAALSHRALSDLSGGQQQRVFLARALAQQPHILLMDEPFNGVDAATQEATLSLLDALKRQQVTVLVSTHDLSMASQRFESVLLLNRRLVAYGPAAQVFTSENIRQVFGGQVLFVDGAAVIDECCHESEG